MIIRSLQELLDRSYFTAQQIVSGIDSLELRANDPEEIRRLQEHLAVWAEWLLDMSDDCHFQHYVDTQDALRPPPKPEVVWQVDRDHFKSSSEPVVYFIRMGDLIKIGTSANFLSRVKSLRSQYSGQLTVIATTTGYFNVEQRYHEKFEHLRKYGEWFEAAPELLAEIDQLREVSA